MKRLTFALLTLATLVTLQLASACRCAQAANPAVKDRPNVLLVLCDDIRWNALGCMGHPHLKTPILDQMAASGLRMDRFYSAHPSCSPTRGSVMTGRHPNRCGREPGVGSPARYQRLFRNHANRRQRRGCLSDRIQRWHEFGAVPGECRRRCLQ